jgi:hypothetical protein
MAISGVCLSRETQKTLAARPDKYHDNSYAQLDAWRDPFKTGCQPREAAVALLALLEARFGLIARSRKNVGQRNENPHFFGSALNAGSPPNGQNTVLLWISWPVATERSPPVPLRKIFAFVLVRELSKNRV